MAAPVIQFKRGLLANLPGLRAGEPGFTTDSKDLYVGIDSTTGNNQFVGSGRFWSVNSTTVGSGVNLVEGTDNGTNFITLKSPDSLSGIVTFVMPSADGNANDVLKTDGSGNLSFAAPAASTFDIAADSAQLMRLAQVQQLHLLERQMKLRPLLQITRFRLVFQMM